MTYLRARKNLKFSRNRQLTAELTALERLKNPKMTYSGKNGVATFSQILLIKSFLYLRVTMTNIRALMSSNTARSDQGPQS